ncbi:MAG: hypothetical protein U0556_12245 [Dehalococcoidia bacterium]
MILADLALARRLEAAETAAAAEFAEAYREIFPVAGAASLSVAGGAAVYCGRGSVVNHASGMGLNGPVTRDNLDEVEAFFADRDEPTAIEWCPLAHQSLLEVVGERAYRISSATNMLYLPLEGWADPSPVIEVREVGPSERADWAQVNALGFGDGVTPRFEDLYVVYGRLASARLFLAEIDGSVAGAGLVRLHNDSALLSATSVLPAFRERGVHAALIAKRIAAACAAGIRLAVVRAGPGSASQRNLERAGFRIAYTRLRLISRSAEQA